MPETYALDPTVEWAKFFQRLERRESNMKVRDDATQEKTAHLTLPTCLIATGLRLSNSLLPSSFTSPANTSFIVSLASSGPFGRAHP
eukprot:751627-Hanusia_phi.AAC.5